jgi:hypothetical protein
MWAKRAGDRSWPTCDFPALQARTADWGEADARPGLAGVAGGGTGVGLADRFKRVSVTTAAREPASRPTLIRPLASPDDGTCRHAGHAVTPPGCPVLPVKRIADGSLVWRWRWVGVDLLTSR